MRNLETWQAAGANPRGFPYRPVLAAYHRSGKHFVHGAVLRALDRVRTRLPDPDPSADARRLRLFLNIALDKADGAYDEQTYLALSLLPMPPTGTEHWRRPEAALRQHDRLFVALVADLLRFELAAADGSTDLLPMDRPEAGLVAKRHHHGLRCVTPALRRLGLADAVTATDPTAAARQLWEAVDQTLDDTERLVLELTMLPVYVLHDEYLFIRCLQAFETTFALVAGALDSTVVALRRGDIPTAAALLRAAGQDLTDATPLWSLLATIRVDAFNDFRRFTDGASAIQSRNYKLVEALCRTPERERLDSLAYRSVPEVRDRILAGLPTVDEAYRAATTSGTANPAHLDELSDAMKGFADALRRWRHTHYRLAVRMLGRQPGTGYTEGPAYLRRVRSLPVFHAGQGCGGRTGDDHPPAEGPSGCAAHDPVSASRPQGDRAAR